MKVLVEGHRYELDLFERSVVENPQAGENELCDAEQPVVLQFIHKEKDPATGVFVTVSNGTTDEEVLKVLLNRLQFLNAKCPCNENIIAIAAVGKAMVALDRRTADRELRKVEGTVKQ